MVEKFYFSAFFSKNISIMYFKTSGMAFWRGIGMFSLNQTCWGHQSFTYKPQPKAIELYSL
jgi:hypothetical protein